MNTRLILLFLTFFVGEFSILGLKCRICQESFIEESCNEYPELQMHGCKVVNIYFLPNKLSGTKKAKLPDFVNPSADNSSKIRHDFRIKWFKN
jgi:hypothetical protein